ncbi:MAG: diaminopimelate decarboxylase [Phormidium sp. BM_Day4_Bin.17]|nr:diaminopimelate decarboxylase [Phormidium sp. BM_Day4_Bin.17]UCJ14398.1 MAG: diaminopimelate decarboxylase [Phormidium sp. PBR-2020]
MVSTPSLETPLSGRTFLETAIASTSPNQSLVPLTTRLGDNDALEIGGCDVPTLVRRFGSPLYILDESTLRSACRQYRDAFARYYKGDALVLFASKAWSCLAVCALVASEGLGTDVVSGGELYTALRAGVAPDRIYLHGNNKSAQELNYAIESGITVVADNWQDLRLLVELNSDRPNPVRVMLRFTPGIECHTHEYIQTGHIDSKFGFDPDSLDEVLQFVAEQPSLNCIGLHAHIGSQIFELQPHHDLPEVMVSWLQRAHAYNLPVTELNVGGGLGIRYTEADDPPSIEAWVKTICDRLSRACAEANLPLPRLLCEPGRSLIGTACVTAYSIGSCKTVPGLREYITVDGGMSDNPRPITYQSLYRAVIANRMNAPATETVTIAGKHCESGDVVIADAKLPKTEAGDTLVVMGTGAYNYSMSSNYNRLPRPAAVLVCEGEANLILQRETYEDLLRQDRLPERLAPKQGS